MAYAFYQEFNEYDGWRHNAELNGSFNLTRHLQFDIDDIFFLTEDPLRASEIRVPQTIEELDEMPLYRIDPTIRRSRERYWQNTGVAGLTYEFGQTNSLIVRYRHSILRNEDPTIEDSEEHTPSLHFLYWFSQRWNMELSGSYTRGIFEISEDFNRYIGTARITNRLTSAFSMYAQYEHTYLDYIPQEAVPGDQQVYNPSIGFIYDHQGQLLFSLDVGYFLRTFEESDFNDADGLTVDAVFRKNFRRGFIAITGSGGYDYFYFGAENLGFTKYYEALGEARYNITRKLSTDIFGGYREDDFEDTIPERTDKSTRAGAGLTFQFLKWAALRLEYAYRQIQSTLVLNEYTENRGLATILITPSQPITF